MSSSKQTPTDYSDTDASASDCGDPGCHHDHEARVPIRVEPKIGRNEPCPCGSGSKFKKCCGK